MSFFENAEKSEILADNFQRKIYSDRLAITFAEYTEIMDDFAEDVEKGLTSNPKFLLPKYFYDSKGSELFEEITRLEEYYPTEVERSIIQDISGKLPLLLNGISTIIEIGSGSSNKTRHIIESFTENRDNINYVPLDISDIIVDSSKYLVKRFDNITIEGIVAEYNGGLEIASEINQKPKLYLFLGSSIGNFTFDESIQFLDNLCSSMDKHDRLLIGFDRIKDREVLHNAYDDSQGVTAKFNLNILDRINQELDADFDLDSFDHQIKFNEDKSRIEMHLVSNKLQRVKINDLDLQIQFEAAESIHTENSYKYSQKMIKKLADASGFEIENNFMDNQKYFSLCLFKKS